MKMEAAYGKDGGIYFSGSAEDRGSGVVLVLSWQQVRILEVLTDSDHGGAAHNWFYPALFGLPLERSKRDRALTGSERAMLSRTLRRMQDKELIEISPTKWITLTEWGKDLLTWLREWRGWAAWEATVKH